MPALIGAIVGAAIITFVMSWLIDRLAFRRFGLGVRAVVPTAIAVLIAIVFYGFGASTDGVWDPKDGVVTYPIGGAIAAVLRYLQLRGRRAAPEDAS